MTIIPWPIDKDWLKLNGRLRFNGHIKMQGASQYLRSVIDHATGAPIGMSVTETIYKDNRSNGELAGKAIRKFHVGAETFDDLDAAIAHLNSEQMAERSGEVPE